MNLIFLGFAACVLWGVRIRWRGCDDDYLSMEKGNIFRGILALTVACHHLAEETGDGSLFHMFAFMGCLPVAYFFFQSGYGLQKSYARKPGYRTTILKKRIPSVLVPYLAVTALYWLLSAAEGEPYTMGQVLASFTSGDPIARFSWYIVHILVLYVGFYLTTALYRGDQLRDVAWNTLFLLLQMKVTFGNPLLQTLGGCSMEIYMLHGLFMSLFRGNRIYLATPVLWCAVVLICTCLAAYGLRRLFDRKR